MNKIILKYSFILLLLYLFNWWLFYYAPFHVPSHIPSTPINISGLLLLVCMAVVIRYFQKQLLKKDAHLKVFLLTLLSTFVCLIAETVFQSIRLEADTFTEKLFYFFQGIFIMPLFGAVIAFFTALVLKRKLAKRQINSES